MRVAYENAHDCRKSGVVRGLQSGERPGHRECPDHATANRHPRSITGADCALSGRAARADSDERARSAEGRRARQVVEDQCDAEGHAAAGLSLIHISEPTRLLSISYAV